MGRGVTTSPANKRISKEDKRQESTSKRTRKFKYPVLSDTWGEEEYKEDQPTHNSPQPPSSPIPHSIPPPTPPPPPPCPTSQYTSTSYPSPHKPDPIPEETSPPESPPIKSPLPAIRMTRNHQLPDMEDDLFQKKEDDLGENGAMEDIRVSQEPIETIKEDRKAPEVPDSTQENQEDSQSTPLLNKELEEASTRDGYEDRPTLLDVAFNCTIRAISNPAVTENNQKIEDNPFERRQPRDITVNGISLMSIMKNKRKESIKNSPIGKKNDKRTKNKPGTATPPVAKITKYFEMIGRNNIENNEDRRRKTSTTKDIDVDNSDSIADNNSEDDNTGRNEEFGRVNYEENNKK